MKRRTVVASRGRQMLRIGTLLASATLVMGGCVKAKQDSLQPKSRYADTIYHLIVPVFIAGGVVFALVLGGTLYFAARFRVPTDAPLEGEEIPEPIHGNFKLELGWTITPALILLVVSVATVVSVFKLAQEPPKSSPHVEVIGQQWWWEFRYNLDPAHKSTYNDIVTANELVIPANTDIALKMDSRDVIHGFWAPELQGKRDAVPGHPTEFNIAATKPGTYFGQCSVFCGLSHANMRFQVIALPKAEYDEWVRHQQTPAVTPASGTALDGANLFISQCGACHNVRGVHKVNPKDMPLTSGAAPDLTHLMTRTIFASGEFDLRVPTAACVAKGLQYADDPSCINEGKLRAWLHHPESMLPMAANGIDGKKGTLRGMPDLNLSQTAIDQLVAFLKTLK